MNQSLSRTSSDDPLGEDAAEQSAAPMGAANQAHAVDGAEASVPSIAAHLCMPAEIPEPIEAPQDFGDRKAYAFKDPKAGEHDPWYVVLPNMNAVKLGYHADDATDKAHAEFIASAINRAMALPRAIKQALKRFGESQFHCGHDQATSEFKNFHRLLCERFGYVHDERNWQRDQLSLIEWIASDLPRASEQADEAVTELIEKLRDHHKRDIVDFDILLEAATSLEALGADAARYRHLRDCNSGSLVIVEIIGMGEEDQVVLTEDDADKAIDAARAKDSK